MRINYSHPLGFFIANPIEPIKLAGGANIVYSEEIFLQ